MIEIALTENTENTFLKTEPPVFTIGEENVKTWDDYRALAKKIITAHINLPAVIIKNLNADISINWLAVALFVESCFINGKLECAVFKVADKSAAVQSYKPFVALTIGLKYIIRIYSEEPAYIYKEISSLSYLGLNIREDYLNNKLYLELPDNGECQKLTAQTLQETLTAVGILKCLALAQKAAHICAEITKSETSPRPDVDKAIADVVSFVRSWLD